MVRLAYIVSAYHSICSDPVIKVLKFICGKAIASSEGKPLFIEYLMAINLSKPFFVKCSLLIIISDALLNNL
jgi:hypothetical protein